MITRRGLLARLGLTGGAALLATTAYAQRGVDASAFGLELGSDADQSVALQAAIDAAIGLDQPLLLPSGRFRVSDLSVSAPFRLMGAIDTRLVLGSGAHLLSISDCSHVSIESIQFDGDRKGDSDSGLVELRDASGVVIRDCGVAQAAGSGLVLRRSAGAISGCNFADIADTGIFSNDSLGLDITGNSISRCGNGGVRIWRSETGHDGSLISGNRIAGIDWRGGGNGQNGNGINVFRADGVIISDNQLADCAFSAIRLNSTNNSLISGNLCRQSGEIAIFSEFAFSGSIIANNIVDGAAGGISMTNFDRGGRLSVCSGNIVRNIAAGSITNPGVTPYGIAAEADAVIADNVVEAVPGPGIVVGWGPYLRDVVVSGNLLRDCQSGIVVSVAPGAGHASISGNVISGARDHAIAAARWDDIVSTDLQGEVADYPALSVAGNSIL